MVSVASLWICGTDFKILFTNATKSYHSHPRNRRDRRKLMSAFLWYLYNPIIDPTIEVDIESVPTTFKIITPNVYGQLSLLRVGGAIGRRTTVFAHKDPTSPFIIKEQYVDPRRRFSEGELLAKIHAGRDFPGVVRLESFEEVTIDGARIMTSSHRIKTRLVLRDKGRPFVEIQTFREMLKVVYDLLEGRWLHLLASPY